MKLITNETTPKQALEILKERANEPMVTRDDVNALIKCFGQLTGRVAKLENKGPENPFDIFIGPPDEG